jgi:hypothetical protein
MNCDIDGCPGEAVRPLTLDSPLMKLRLNVCEYHGGTNLEPAKRVIRGHVAATPLPTRAISWIVSKFRRPKLGPGEKRVGLWK